MALFSYKVLDGAGKAEKGTLHAASMKEAKAALKGMGKFVVDVRPAQAEGIDIGRILSLGRPFKPSVAMLAQFCRQFATLLEATIPYDTALQMVADQTSDLRMRSVIADVRGAVVEGAYLADAFAANPRVFPPMMVSMVRAGEASGTLVVIMVRMAEYFENMGRIRGKVGSVLIYPAFMTLFGTGVVIFMVTYILPKITRLLENFGAQLPWSTRLLIGVSDLLTHWWWLILLVLGAAFWWLGRYLATPEGRLRWDGLELKLPLWRAFRKKVLIQRFCQTLATLLKSHVELKTALAIAGDVLENGVYRQAMRGVMMDVQNKGMTLSSALRKTAMFPEDMVQMVAIGEETASLDAMLDNTARRMEQEVNNTLNSAMALFEPLLILIMGGVVGFIVLSVMLPMLKLNQIVR